MADEAGKPALAWVHEPTISDGKITYRYKNSGDADATFVGESLTAFSRAGTNTSQGFQSENFAAGTEEEREAYLPADLPDGAITISVQIQATGGEVWDSELLHELAGTIAGGSLHAAGTAAAGAAGSLAVEAVDVKLDNEELVIHYRITGDAQLDDVSILLMMFDPQGGSSWVNSIRTEVDREDIFRTPIPFGEVMDSDEGWVIEASVLAADTTAGVQAIARIHFPVSRVDGKVVAAGDWASSSDS